MIITPTQSTFEEHQYYPAFMYKVSDNETIKLKLLQQQKIMSTVNYDYEIKIDDSQ